MVRYVKVQWVNHTYLKFDSNVFSYKYTCWFLRQKGKSLDMIKKLRIMTQKKSNEYTEINLGHYNNTVAASLTVETLNIPVFSKPCYSMEQVIRIPDGDVNTTKYSLMVDSTKFIQSQENFLSYCLPVGPDSVQVDQHILVMFCQAGWLHWWWPGLWKVLPMLAKLTWLLHSLLAQLWCFGLRKGLVRYFENWWKFQMQACN